MELGGNAVVAAVSRAAGHTFSKGHEDGIRLVAGLGVEGDAHLGATVKHRSRVARDPTQPNLRQVHLIHAELHDELRERGFDVAPGAMGENVTTRCSSSTRRSSRPARPGAPPALRADIPRAQAERVATGGAIGVPGKDAGVGTVR